jgi:hypothetical protein
MLLGGDDARESTRFIGLIDKKYLIMDFSGILFWVIYWKWAVFGIYEVNRERYWNIC